MALVQIETKKTTWSSVLNTILAWNTASRWRKASKCKSLIKQVQLHLTILKNRRDAITRQSRADIAQLLQNGQLQQALDRVEQLYKDQYLMSAYDQINHYCLYIITNLSHINKHSSAQSLPIEVSEAVSTLIFAASRCGEVPELHMLRSLFKERYGYKFEIANVELLPGNLVNSQLKQSLCINSVPDDVKLNLISEISRKFTLNLESRNHERSVKPKVGTPQINEKYIVYLDDLEKKSLKQEGGSSKNVPYNSRNRRIGTNVTKNSATKGSTRKPIIPRSQFSSSSTRQPLSKNQCNMLLNNRFSLDGSIDRWKAQEGSVSSCSSHVHPKLPEYEDVVSKVEDFKAENRQLKRFSY